MARYGVPWAAFICAPMNIRNFLGIFTEKVLPKGWGEAPLMHLPHYFCSQTVILDRLCWGGTFLRCWKLGTTRVLSHPIALNPNHPSSCPSFLLWKNEQLDLDFGHKLSSTTYFLVVYTLCTTQTTVQDKKGCLGMWVRSAMIIVVLSCCVCLFV